MSDDPAIRIDEQGVMIKLSGNKEVARKQWEKARKLINMHLEIDEEPETQPKTKSEIKHKPWSDEEEEIIANNLDKKPAQLDELLSKEGYERTRGAIHQKKKELQKQQKDEDYNRGAWGDWEEEHLINEYHRKTLSEIATDLNRPYGTTYQRKDKLIREGRLTPKEKQKRPDDRINDIKQEQEEAEPESDGNFPDTLIKYLWRNTDWKFYETRASRIMDIQKILESKYGMNITKEQVEQFVEETEAET